MTSSCKGPVTLDDNDIFQPIFVSSEMGAAPIPDDKIKWVSWSPVIPFTLGDTKILLVVVKCERALTLHTPVTQVTLS